MPETKPNPDAGLVERLRARETRARQDAADSFTTMGRDAYLEDAELDEAAASRITELEAANAGWLGTVEKYLLLMREYLARAQSAEARLAVVTEALRPIVEEFGCSIQQYHKIGPDYTLSGGVEVLNVGVLLDREPLIEAARQALSESRDGEQGEGLLSGLLPPERDYSPGEVRILDGKRRRFVEYGDKGEVWELIPSTPAASKDSATPDDDRADCATCEGAGKTLIDEQSRDHDAYGYVPCDDCDGTGKAQ